MSEHAFVHTAICVCGCIFVLSLMSMHMAHNYDMMELAMFPANNVNSVCVCMYESV